MTPAETLPSEFPDALPIGTRLGDFTVTRVIGLGGFGIVYMAHDHALERTVAIKEYLPVTIAGRTSAQTVLVRSTHQQDTYTSGLQSFMREARLQARFSHPALLEVYRVWEQNGTAYMAMRYYPGNSLRDLRLDADSTRMFDESSLQRIMSPVFDALEELHSQNVLHRDVSPDNILMTPSGAPVLLDFGSARTVIAGDEQSLTTVLKPGYAPLEQYADDGTMEQGPWTDVYGLGAVLHYLAIGSAPPQAVTRLLGGTLRAFEDVAASRYSQAFVSAVTAALAVKTQDRLQNVAAFREALGWGNEQASEAATTVLTPPTLVSANDTSHSEAASPSSIRQQPLLPVAQTEPSQPSAQRPGPRLLLIGSLLAMALGGVAYFVSTRPASQAPVVPIVAPALPPVPAPSAPLSAPAPAPVPAAGTPKQSAPTARDESNPTPSGNKAEAASSAPKNQEKRPTQKLTNNSPTASTPALPKPRSPGNGGNTEQATATCERLFAKLSLGNAVLTETEQKQLPGCR